MIAYLEELLAKLFGGVRDTVAIPVRADDKRPNDKIMKGRS